MLEEIRRLEAQGVPEDDYASWGKEVQDFTMADLELLDANIHCGYHRAKIFDRLEVLKSEARAGLGE